MEKAGERLGYLERVERDVARCWLIVDDVCGRGQSMRHAGWARNASVIEERTVRLCSTVEERQGMALVSPTIN